MVCDIMVYCPETKSWHLVQETEVVEVDGFFVAVHTDEQTHPQTPPVPQNKCRSEVRFYTVCTEDVVCASCQEKLVQLNHILGRGLPQRNIGRC